MVVERPGFLEGGMTGAGRRPNQRDFLPSDRRGGPSARLGDRQERRHSGATVDGPDSVCLGVCEDRASGQRAPPRETWNQGPWFKSQLAMCPGQMVLASLGLRFPVCEMGSRTPMTKNWWLETSILIADVFGKLTMYQAQLIPTITLGANAI